MAAAGGGWINEAVIVVLRFARHVRNRARGRVSRIRGGLQLFEQAAGAGISFFVLCCYGIFILLALALFALWVWMLIDNFGRQEYEFPNSTGNSKNTWLIINIVGFLLGFAGIVAIVYYFMVFKKIKRGTVAPQWAGNAPASTPGAPPAPTYAPPAPTYAPPAPPAPTYAPPAPTYAPPAPPAAPPAPSAPPVAPPAPPTSDAPPSDPGQPPA